MTSLSETYRVSIEQIRTLRGLFVDMDIDYRATRHQARGDAEAVLDRIEARPLTSPSETPLDLDAIEARANAAQNFSQTADDLLVSRGVFSAHAYSDVPDLVRRIRELEARPRTVGDLTARDLGRRVRIEFTEFTLDAMEYAGSLTGGPCLVMRSGERGWPNFDTPVEFLDDEEASHE